MEMRTSKTEEHMVYQLGKGLTSLASPEDIEQTYRYALLLDVTAAMAIVPVHHPTDGQCGRILPKVPIMPKKRKTGRLVQSAKRSDSPACLSRSNAI